MTDSNGLGGAVAANHPRLDPSPVSKKGSPNARALAGSLLVIFTVAYGVVFLRSTSKWWFEDDPLQFARAAAISSPFDIFVDPRVLHGWGTGASLVPMHVLSYWLDVRFFGISPEAARIHSLGSLCLVVLLMYLFLVRLGLAPAAAASAGVLWLGLPATVAVFEFLGTRHYLEGLGWSLAAGLLLIRVGQSPPDERRTPESLLLLLCASAAMLSKEIYVTTLPVFLLAYALWRRRRVLAAAAPALVVAYAVYRRAMLGSGASYPHPPFGVAEYLSYLRVLPYTFSASDAGWIFYAGLAAVAAWASWRSRAGRRAGFLLTALLAAALAATYPTVPAVLLTYRTPGTWYRAVFVIHTIALLGLAYLVGRYGRATLRIGALVVALAVLVPGAVRTRRHWDEGFARSEAEGRFYLAHPDRLVYSEEPAYWFLPGLDALYDVRPPHSVGRYDPSRAYLQELLRQHSTIWRRGDGTWIEDDALYASLRAEAPRDP